MRFNNSSKTNWTWEEKDLRNKTNSYWKSICKISRPLQGRTNTTGCFR
ncbi:hypothetical protein ACHAWF_000762, partial [Thalassiosira exigua]